MAANQVTRVPETMASQLKAYMGNRRAMMQRIEQEDLRQLQTTAAGK